MESESTLSSSSQDLEPVSNDVYSPPKTRGRGRGRPRGRSRSRSRGILRVSGGRGRASGSRGRGRHTKSAGAVRDVQSVLAALKNRKERIERRLEEMDEEGMRSMLRKIMEKSPNLLFDEMEPVQQGGGGGYHPPEGTELPSWCVCSHCREMPKDIEKKCCRRHPADCISQTPDIEALCLNEAVLAISRWLWNDLMALEDDEQTAKGFRHAAYRQFVLWQHHRLGAGIRVVIPSCCVWRIRDRYPDPFGQYKGFVPA